MLKEMKLAGLIMDSSNHAPAIILKDLEDKEVISIWIGLLEASAIAVELEKIDVPRPMTHDLLKNVFNRLNIRVLKVLLLGIIIRSEFFQHVYEILIVYI